MKELQDITEEDLPSACHDLDTKAILDENSLQYVLLNVVDFLEANSDESQQRERERKSDLSRTTNHLRPDNI